MFYVKQIYGPEGVFYKLSLSCYEAKQEKYTYSVCPFKEVKQTADTNPSVVIGRHPVWSSQGSDGFVLKMTEGDRANCPEGMARVSVVSSFVVDKLHLGPESEG